MTRKKLKMAWIESDAARKASFRKRKQGLMKKLEELNTLCDVHGFMIIYGAEEQVPTVWPSQAVAEELLERFMSVSEMERCRKNVNHEGYLKERIIKSQELMAKHARWNRELQASHFMNQLQWGRKRFGNLRPAELAELVWLVEERRREIAKRRNLSQHVGGFSSLPAPALNVLVPPASPELEIYLPQMSFPGEEEEEGFVPQFSSGMDNPGTGTSLLPTSGPPMEDLLPASGPEAETGAGLIDNNHGSNMWEQWFFDLMNEPSTEDAARTTWNDIGAAMGAPAMYPNVSSAGPGTVLPGKAMGVTTGAAPNIGSAEEIGSGVITGRDRSMGPRCGNNMDVKLPLEDIGGDDDSLAFLLQDGDVGGRENNRFPRQDKNSLAFLLQDGDVGGRENTRLPRQDRPADQSEAIYEVMQPQLDFTNNMDWLFLP